jgi:CDP-glycerol glycerophosphotransferase
VQDIATGTWRLSLPQSVLDETTVAPEALTLRDHEVT